MTKKICRNCGKKMRKAYMGKLTGFQQIGFFCPRCERPILHKETGRKEIHAEGGRSL